MKFKFYLMVMAGLALALTRPNMPAVGADSERKATVMNTKGKWKLIHGNDLHFLYTFPFQQDSCAEGTEGGSLDILLSDGRLTSYFCDSPDHPSCPPPDDGFTCARLIIPKNRSFTQRLAAVVVPLFQESPARYITPLARGLEAELSDSVVSLQGGRLDLAPTLQEMEPGTYSLRLESLSSAAKANLPVQLQWSGSGPASVLVPGIQPGLYRFIRLAQNGEPAGLDAWVLVSSPDRFAKDTEAYHSIVEETKKWPDDIDARAPRAVLRAYLDSLSR